MLKKEKPTLENYSKPDLIYNSKYSFYNYYRNSKIFNNLSLKSKYSFLVELFNDLNKFNKIKHEKKKKKRKKQMCMIQLQNYIMIFLESILINTINYQMQTEIK